MRYINPRLTLTSVDINNERTHKYKDRPSRTRIRTGTSLTSTKIGTTPTTFKDCRSQY